MSADPIIIILGCEQPAKYGCEGCHTDVGAACNFANGRASALVDASTHQKIQTQSAATGFDAIAVGAIALTLIVKKLCF